MKTQPENADFIRAIKNLKEGESIEVDEGTLICESVFDVPTHFPWHQRVFEPGMILHLKGSNVRIFVEAEKIDRVPQHKDMANFADRQIKGDKVLPADRGIDYSKEKK